MHRDVALKMHARDSGAVALALVRLRVLGGSCREEKTRRGFAISRHPSCNAAISLSPRSISSGCCTLIGKHRPAALIAIGQRFLQITTLVRRRAKPASQTRSQISDSVYADIETIRCPLQCTRHASLPFLFVLFPPYQLAVL